MDFRKEIVDYLETFNHEKDLNALLGQVIVMNYVATHRMNQAISCIKLTPLLTTQNELSNKQPFKLITYTQYTHYETQATSTTKLDNYTHQTSQIVNYANFSLEEVMLLSMQFQD